MSAKDALGKMQNLLAEGRVVWAGHMDPPERPLAPLEDANDFSWCELHQPGECGGHWSWDKRTMFSAARGGGPAFDNATIQSFVCFNHYLANEYGLWPMKDKLKWTHYAPPQVYFRDAPLWGWSSRVLPIRAARALYGVLDRGVRVRVGGWKYAPVRRALRRVRWWWQGVWWDAFYGFIHFGTEEKACDICGRQDSHAHDGWLRGRRLREAQ